MKLRAVHEGRKLRDVATEIFRRGLAQPHSPPHRVQLPLIHCPPNSPTPSLTETDIDRLLVEDELKTFNDPSGH